MIKRLSNDCNYSLLLPIFLFYLISVGVQSLAADLDGADVKNVVTKQIVFCLISLAAMGIVSKISTSFLLKYAPVFYVLSLGVMALLYWFYDPAMYAAIRRFFISALGADEAEFYFVDGSFDDRG
jgi:rod shape determining protein RodA